ncbi:hypothetical protein MRX96_047861 [Rhipicephalus microplus]
MMTRPLAPDAAVLRQFDNKSVRHRQSRPSVQPGIVREMLYGYPRNAAHAFSNTRITRARVRTPWCRESGKNAAGSSRAPYLIERPGSGCSRRGRREPSEQRSRRSLGYHRLSPGSPRHPGTWRGPVHRPITAQHGRPPAIDATRHVRRSPAPSSAHRRSRVSAHARKRTPTWTLNARACASVAGKRGARVLILQL